MEVYDYNGDGEWSKEEIIRRYAVYCRELKISRATDLSPIVSTEGEKTWIWPLMDKVITGIEQGDAACRRIGVEFIDQDRKFAFGEILKSNTARALRRSDLTIEEKERVSRRIVNMLIDGNVPHEYKQYAKLLKKIGMEGYWPEIEGRINRSNRYVMKYYRYFKSVP